MDTTPKDDGKRAPRMAVALATYKEAEARKIDNQPETQFKVRDQARLLYQEAVKLDPTSVEGHRGLVRVYVDLGDFKLAQEAVAKAQAKFPKEHIFWFEQAQIHNRRHEFTDAVRCLNKAVEMDPENRGYMTTLGLTLARSGQTDQAVALLTRSMGPASAHYNVARMLTHLQRPDEAKQHLKVALQSNPNLDDARDMLARLESGERPNLAVDFQTKQ